MTGWASVPSSTHTGAHEGEPTGTLPARTWPEADSASLLQASTTEPNSENGLGS